MTTGDRCYTNLAPRIPKLCMGTIQTQVANEGHRSRATERTERAFESAPSDAAMLRELGDREVR